VKEDPGVRAGSPPSTFSAFAAMKCPATHPGVRSTRPRVRIANTGLPVAAMVLALVGAGCAGVFGFDGTSDSVGWHASGTLRHPSILPQQGDGYVIPPPWSARQSNFGSDELVGLIVRATRAVAEADPGWQAGIGDLSRHNGGGSVEHKSHQSGRDVDIFYYAANGAGRAERPGNSMIHYERNGRAVRWSPPQGVAAPAKPVPDMRFDVRRNWRFIRALLRDSDVEVQWIFVQRDLAARLIQQGVAEGDDPVLLARASQIVRQPSDAEAHDDHMHVRIYCDPSDRALGCADHGPVRWWKKHWKYMEPPFGRPSGVDASSALLQVLRTREQILVGRPRATS
jgi:penicillin-insensitive murein DD-endopeptidase